MSTYIPAKVSTQYIFFASLVSQANTKLMQVNPTIAAGDFKVSIDGGALSDLGTLPAVTPAGSTMVKFTLSTSEMAGANATVVCIDAAGSEWCDLVVNIPTAARQIDDLAYPATSGRSMVVDASGLVDANTVKIGPTGSGTAQTARDVGASVLLSTGTGTGQLDFTSGIVKANLSQILGTTTATPATAGVLDINVKNINNVVAATPGASGGILISGSNSGTTTLGALTVTGATTHTGATVHTGNVSFVDGITVAAPSTANRAGVTVTGNGTGAGVSVTGGNGATGNAIDAIAASTNGNGLAATATGTGNALKLSSVSGDALLTVVSTSGHGATFAGTGTTKHGVNATGGATSSNGITATGGGTGSGILATSGSGATGDGIKATAASTNGNGLAATGIGTGSGLNGTAGATGHGLLVAGGATSGHGISALGSTSGNGMLLTAAGNSSGLAVAGSGTGNGMSAISGSGATGDGIKATSFATNGNGLNLIANGTGDGLLSTGGASAGGDGIAAAAGGGVDIRGAITGNVTGNLSGSVGSVTGAVGSVTGAVGSVTGNVGGNVVGSVGSVTTVSAGAITNASFAVDTGLKPIRSNTAAAGGATSITLDSSASAIDSFYVNTLIVLTGGTGVGQARFITAYTGATKGAIVTAWVTNPDSSTTFSILPFDAVPGATAPTASQVATAVWQDLLAGSDFSTASSIGKLLKDDVDVAISSRLAPTVAARTLDVSAAGEAGVDWANVGSPTTTVGLTGTTISSSQVVASVTGAVGSVTGAVGSVTGSVGSVVGAVGSVTAGVTVTTNNDKTGYALTSGERNSVADALLDRDMSTGTDSGSTTVRTVRQALRFLRNKWSISGGTLIVKKEDDSTTSWSGTVTQTAGNPVSEIDPAG